MAWKSGTSLKIKISQDLEKKNLLYSSKQKRWWNFPPVRERLQVKYSPPVRCRSMQIGISNQNGIND
jgi:outer membrane usher protein FimD/PapC